MGFPRWREPRDKGSRKSTGGRRTEEGGKWDSHCTGNQGTKGGGSLIVGGKRNNQLIRWQEPRKIGKTFALHL